MDFDLLPVDLIISEVGLDTPLIELVAALNAADLDIVEPFEAIVVVPEVAAAELEILGELYIPVQSGIGGHAVPLHELLLWPEEPEAVNDNLEEDDELALTIILLLAA